MNDYSVFLKLGGSYNDVVCVQSGLSSSRAQQVCVALNQKQPDSYFFSNSKWAQAEKELVLVVKNQNQPN